MRTFPSAPANRLALALVVLTAPLLFFTAAGCIGDPNDPETWAKQHYSLCVSSCTGQRVYVAKPSRVDFSIPALNPST